MSRFKKEKTRAFAWKVNKDGDIALCTRDCEVATYNKRIGCLVIRGYKTEAVFHVVGASMPKVRRFTMKFLRSNCDILKCRSKKFVLAGYERTDLIVAKEASSIEGLVWNRRMDGYCWMEDKKGNIVTSYNSNYVFGDREDSSKLNEELAKRNTFEQSLKELQNLV